LINFIVKNENNYNYTTISCSKKWKRNIILHVFKNETQKHKIEVLCIICLLVYTIMPL